MSKAVRITSIIWMILCFGMVLIFGIVGAFTMGNIDAIAQETVKQANDAQVTLELAKAAAETLAVSMIVLAVYFLVGFILCIVLIVKANKPMRKGAGIALGVVSAVFGAEVPGILFIVHAAKDLN